MGYLGKSTVEFPEVERVRHRNTIQYMILEWLKKHPNSSIKKILVGIHIPVTSIAPRINGLVLESKIQPSLCKYCLSTTVYKVK